MKDKILVSFSGGRTSAYMLKYILDNYKDSNIVTVYANTGKEDEETLEFINECSKRWNHHIYWIEAVPFTKKGWGVTFNIVDFETASRNGEPFERMIKLLGIPCSAAPFCSDQLKKHVILSFMNVNFLTDYYTAIGIRAEEIDRISPQAKKRKLWYPFIENGIGKKDVDDFWSKQDFKLHLEQPLGNCDICWKKSDRKLIELAQKYPEKFKWWDEMEVKYQNVRIKDKETMFFRGGRNAKYFINIAEFYREQLDLFEYDDTPNGCSESCEVF